MNESVGFFAALVAGFLSFISPCVLPLVPVYLTLMTGLSAQELESKSDRPVLHIFVSSLAYCLGFSAVFVTLGLTATTLGSFLINNLRIFEVASGIVIIILGIHMTGLVKIGFLYRSFKLGAKAKNPQSGAKTRGPLFYLRTFLMGAAFAFGWTPCVGPILAGVLALAATQESVLEGGMLLGVYSAGLAVPFILAGLLFTAFTSTYKNFRKHLRAVEIVSGALLIVFGILLAMHQFTFLAGWFARYLPGMETLSPQ